MNDNTEVDRLNAEIADLKRTIEWYQGRTGIMMGEAARGEIAGVARLTDETIMRLFDAANTPTTVTTAHSPWHQEILIRFARLLLSASAPQPAVQVVAGFMLVVPDSPNPDCEEDDGAPWVIDAKRAKTFLSEPGFGPCKLEPIYRASYASPEGMVLAPHFRGYARLGTGQYLLNNSATGAEAELVISVATDEEKAGRVVGDERGNAPGNSIQPDVMAVRIAFTTVAGLDALENQLRKLRDEHFQLAASPSPAPANPTEPLWLSVDFIMPEPGVEVLIDGHEGVEVAHYSEGEPDQTDQMGHDAGWWGYKFAACGRSFGAKDYLREAQGQPKYWMPLPDTPSDDDDENSSQATATVPSAK